MAVRQREANRQNEVRQGEVEVRMMKLESKGNDHKSDRPMKKKNRKGEADEEADEELRE
eukprot:CAMPEP_0175842994 /NCGR_PEP_ID=MMETSP0107_2-20121207/20836_1 /TAXON_ID=195067 ORGANISM="Goniomonas pacifica, Strain CCMP1869" /NCGR_SAMPLE_ID=MMETSP0107_2 /ASSEMBLY_ACC=CAM_ASM_000203 /LENGTH=58 /DNA_ID=CAMNT_0017157219 /DNA_START=255 /DNA_END=433 /DNA_ORIENTATION=-